MTKVVVTGGAGFIGSHLAEELVRRGYSVTIIDDLSTGKKENVKTLLKDEKIEFIKGSVTDLPLLQKIFRDVDNVFHLAAIASPPRSIDDPLSSHEVNVTGTLNVLLSARDNKVKKVIYSSSAAVYGNAPELPKQEDMMPGPESPYAVDKLSGENYCGVFQKVYGLSTVCLRYFNVYGPRQDPNSQYAAVIPKFIKSCIDGNPPIIYGDGEQTRDFIFVKDVAKANILAAERKLNGVYNIGNGTAISVNQLFKIIADHVKSDIKPEYREERAGDIKHSLADISQARKFGFQPGYDMKSGLADTIEWYKK